MTDTKPTILLTGAAGVMGQSLIEELESDFDVVCLRHRTSIGHPGVREVPGDLSSPDLGLPPQLLRALVGRTHAVLHCAASTSWLAKPAEIIATNVEGTTRVIDFARQAGATLYHMSTAFVARPPVDGVVDGRSAYVASKIAAEDVVRQSGDPHVILRPSILIGDSRDGHIAAFQGIHKVAGSILKDALPVLPAGPAALVDCIPQDVVARAVGRLLRTGVTQGEFWLTAGAHALTLRDLVDVTLAVAQQLDLRVSAPRLVGGEMVERLLLPLMEEVLPPLRRRQMRGFLDLMTLFQTESPIQSSLADIGPGYAPDRADLLQAFRRSVEFWALHHGLATVDDLQEAAAA
jgi:nucleoside-diphosphate-sugar epimerase